VEAEPFRPVLRGILLTGEGARFMRSEIAGGQGDSSDVSTRMLWWPETKVAGQYLSHYLSRSLAPVQPADPLPADAIPIEVDLSQAPSVI
jgi:sulfide:quinone oxidoreductase